MVTNNEISYILIDPSNIECIITIYFQSSAGISSDNIMISTAWFEEFNPKDYINADIYKDLMISITKLEYS